MDTKKAYQETMEVQLKEWSVKIGELMAKADKARAEAKDAYRRQIEELRAKQRAVEENMRKLREAGEDAWQEWRAGLEKAWDELERAWESAVARFK